MKKITLSFLIFLALLVSACSTNAQAATETAAPINELTVENPTVSSPVAVGESTQAGLVELNADYENAVSVAMQLLLGTIKLEGTELAVTTEQAAALTPLWTNFKSLSESMRPSQGGPGQGQPNTTTQPVDSGLQTQLDEIIKQIQSTMTADQIKAIAAMQITQEISQTIMEEKGITMGALQNGNGDMNGGGQPPAGGEAPQGEPPAGGPGGGQQPDAAQMETPPTDGGMRRGGMGFIPSELIDALINFLGQK
jgi:hypothetical protein